MDSKKNRIERSAGKITKSSPYDNYLNLNCYEFVDSDEEVNSSIKSPFTDCWETVSMTEDVEEGNDLNKTCKLFSVQNISVPRRYVDTNINNGKRRSVSTKNKVMSKEDNVMKIKKRRRRIVAATDKDKADFEKWASTFNEQCEAIENHQLCTE